MKLLPNNSIGLHICSDNAYSSNGISCYPRPIALSDIIGVSQLIRQDHSETTTYFLHLNPSPLIKCIRQAFTISPEDSKDLLNFLNTLNQSKLELHHQQRTQQSAGFQFYKIEGQIQLIQYEQPEQPEQPE